MREQPKYHIAEDAMKAWRIKAAIYVGLFWVSLIGGYITIALIFHSISYIIISIMVGVLLLLIYVFIYFIPKLRYRRWRYEIFEQEIYIQRGILIMTRTIVPMIRVQHVDTVQGPILKKYKLATVTISTAATVHAIPALTEEDASDLRDRISVLARVDEDDV